MTRHNLIQVLSVILLQTCLLAPAPINAATAVDAFSMAETAEPGRQISFFVDSESVLTIEDVQGPGIDWEPLTGEASQPAFGYTGDVYWLKFALTNSSTGAINRFIKISYPVLDYLDFFFLRNGVVVGKETLGDKYPFEQRPIKNHNFIVPLELPGNSTTDVMIRVQSSSSLQVPISIWKPAPLLENIQQEILLMGLYFGAIIVLLLYNLFVYLSVRERKYLFYVLYMAGTGLFLASLNGLSFQYLWPEAVDWNDRSIPFSLSLFIFFATIFVIDFLDITRARKRLWALYLTVASLSLTGTILSLFLPYTLMIKVVILIAVLAMSAAAFLGVLRLYEGYRPALFYCIAWAVFLLGGFVLALNKFSILPRNLFTESALQLGSVLEGVLLSFALADRLNQEKAQRFQAQQEALEQEKAARKAQTHALDIQRKANEELEEKVSERTRELELVNHDLETLTFSDSLTGVRNRRYFDETIKESLARCFRNHSPLALLLVDLDYFKRLNDTHGHLVGDECLKLTASIMRAQISRSSDMVARYGGEEFAILLQDTNPEGALRVAERVRAAIESALFGNQKTPISITASVGVHCEIPLQNQVPEDFIGKADRALYRAKEQGRNRVCASADD